MKKLLITLGMLLILSPVIYYSFTTAWYVAVVVIGGMLIIGLDLYDDVD